MKATIFYKRGGLDNLIFEQVPDPAVGPEDVLVRVRSCGLNHLDIFTREGAHGVKASLPHVGGLEPAGEIALVGANVTDMKVGDRVLVGGFTYDGTCEYCRAGLENLCVNRKIMGVQRWGGFGEYVGVPRNSVYLLPDSVSFEEASALPGAFGTALHMLVNRAQIQKGEWVLVLAAGSGVGSAAIQIAKLYDCKVIATASSDDKLQKAREIGADFVINYKDNPNFQNDVMRITGDRGVDIAVEHVGPTTWKQSLASLRPTGRLVTCGGTTGRTGETNIWNVFWHQKTILGSNGATPREFEEVIRLLSANKIRPVIDRTFPFAQTREAQAYLMERKQFGKVLVINQ